MSHMKSYWRNISEGQGNMLLREVDRVFACDQLALAKAHRESNQHTGKIVFQMPGLV